MPTKNVELQFKTEDYNYVLEQLRARLIFSEREVMARRTTYKQHEDQFLAYISERDLERQQRAMFAQGEPQYVTLRIPYSYGELMTMHTFYSTVMLGRRPILQYNGRHGESQRQKLAVEAIMNYQMTAGKNIVPLYIWLLDCVKYGRGIVWADWEERYSYFTEEQVVQKQDPSDGTVYSETREIPVRLLQYMGNRLFTTRPQDFRPDPRVPIGYLQDGEFVGREFDLYMNDLVRGGKEGLYYNVAEAKRRFKTAGRGPEIGDRSTRIDPVIDDNPPVIGKPTGKVKAQEIYVNLIPRDWRLKNFGMPQKWVFTVVDKAVIIESRPLGMYHDQFPCFSLEPEFDGYSLHSRSPQEVIRPLEDTLTWLFNSHFYNVRRALNDQIVFDPSMVEPDDVLSPLPGGGIRLKPAAYGTSVGDHITQLGVTDITRQNVADSAFVLNILQRVDGVNDAVMGLISQSGRKTATEVRQGSQFAVNRLKTKAEFMSAQGFGPLAECMLQQTQQYYDQELKFRIAGNLATNQDPFVDVTREAIAGGYDFVSIDGSIPLDRFALANLWRQIFADAARIPGMGQQLDFMAIFNHFAKLSGATDIDQFRIQMQSPEELANAAQRGNLVPIGQPSQGPADEGDERAASRVTAAPQIAGMGTG